MDRFEAMRTLVAAVDGGSLSAASRSLGVPLPTVSRRVSDLEAYLRAQLVVRTSRKLLLTEVGRAYVATCRQILDQLDDAERRATGEYRTPRGDLLITAPVMFGRLHVEPVVLDFLKAYSDINVRLILADYVIDLVENRVDLAVRIGELPDSGLVAARLGAVSWITCASPDYLQTRGTPQIIDDLARHDCIAFEGLYSNGTWEFGQGKDQRIVPIRPQFSVNTASGAIDAALGGAGIARVLSYQVARHIAEGTLVPVLMQFQTLPRPVHLVHGGQPILPLKLRAFLDFAAPRLKMSLAALDGATGRKILA
jgi:DNA-binding transcriptional LysR family regulator